MGLTKPSPVTEYYGQTWWNQQADWMKQHLEAQSSMIRSAEDARKQLESIEQKHGKKTKLGQITKDSGYDGSVYDEHGIVQGAHKSGIDEDFLESDPYRDMAQPGLFTGPLQSGDDKGGGGDEQPDFSWKESATEPWGGTVQFGQGTLVYKKPPGFRSDAAWMEANQDWLIEHGYALTPEQFGQHMGIDIYEPGYVPGMYQPETGIYDEFDPGTYVNPPWYKQNQPAGAYHSPQQIGFRADVANEQRKRQAELERQQIRDWLVSGGGGGGSFGQGGQQDNYGYDGFGNPIYTDPVTGQYPEVAGVPKAEPSISPDAALSDHILQVDTRGLEQLSIPARTRLNQWLESQGFIDQGVYGDYGATSYTRPEDETGNIIFDESDFEQLTDPTIRRWIQWLMGRMGYAPGLQIEYPGVVAP
tara:strand:+ start:494 stop:1741 length:1248 start_codon:yes stop_codon:yes gene_type:complete